MRMQRMRTHRGSWGMLLISEPFSLVLAKTWAELIVSRCLSPGRPVRWATLPQRCPKAEVSENSELALSFPSTQPLFSLFQTGVWFSSLNTFLFLSTRDKLPLHPSDAWCRGVCSTYCLRKYPNCCFLQCTSSHFIVTVNTMECVPPLCTTSDFKLRVNNYSAAN